MRLARDIRASFCSRTLRAASFPGLERPGCPGAPRTHSILHPHQRAAESFPKLIYSLDFAFLMLWLFLAPGLLGGRLAREGVGMVRPRKMGESVESTEWGQTGNHGTYLVGDGERSPMRIVQLGRRLGCPRVGFMLSPAWDLARCPHPLMEGRKNKILP